MDPAYPVRPATTFAFLAALFLSACGGDPVAIPRDRGPAPPEPAAAEQGTSTGATTEAGPARILTPPLGPKPSVAADRDLLRGIREFLHDGGRRVPCGPYDLWTDVDDAFLLVELDHLAARLDAEYEARLGLVPQGPSHEMIVLFSRLRDFQRWEAADADSRRGYAGHASASQGFAVLHADRSRDDVLATTVHELTHLVHRRALGGPLPRWLSEGLADALGDSASSDGFLPLRAAVGAEGELRRLQAALRADTELPTAAALIEKTASSFDRVAANSAVQASYDYELSAFLVRFLLGDEPRRQRFQELLAELSQGGRWSPELFWSRLQSEPSELDASFRSWLLALGSQDAKPS